MANKTALLFLVLVCASFLLVMFEQWGVDHQRCELVEEEEIIFVTVTVTVTPLPEPVLDDDEDTDSVRHWKSTSWCLHNPDFSDFCFYENICFDGEETFYFLDPSLQMEERFPLMLPEFTDHSESEYRMPATDAVQFRDQYSDNSDLYPYINAVSGMKMFKISPRSKKLEQGIISTLSTYIAIQHLSSYFPADRFHFIKDNIMFWEAQRQNQTFSTFLEFPSMDEAFILRARLPDSWEKDLIQVFVALDTRIQYWEDLRERGISNTQPLCMKKAVLIGSKPQFFSGHSEGEAFKQHLYDMLSLARPDIRGWDRGENFHPTVTIYNPRKGDGYHLRNIDQLKDLLQYYQIDFTIISDWEAYPRLRDIGTLFQNTDVLISPHGAFGTNYMWLGAHVSVIEVFPYLLRNNRYEVLAKTLMLNYQALRSWIPVSSNEIMMPLRELELAIIEAFDMQAYSIRNRVSQLYINTNVSFIENDWFLQSGWESIH